MKVNNKMKNRALCANFEKTKYLASFWLGHVVCRRSDGSVYTHSEILPNYWRCKGFVGEAVTHAVNFGNEVVSSGCYACVPCECNNSWRF